MVVACQATAAAADRRKSCAGGAVKRSRRRGIEFVGRVMDGTETEAVTVTIGSGKDAHPRSCRCRPRSVTGSTRPNCFA